MIKINDIKTDLKIDLDISNNNKFQTPILDKNRPIINDISTDRQDIDISLNKNIRLEKWKSNKLDTIYASKKNKVINIRKKINFDNYILQLEKIKKLLKKKNIKKINFWKKYSYKKFLLFLVFISFILYWNKILIENLVTNWYKNILAIKENSTDINSVKSYIRKAKLNFALSSILFDPFTIIPNKNIKNVKYIINGWKDLALLLWESIDVYENTNKFIDKKWWIQNIYITNLLSNLRENYSSINSLLYSALNNYSKVWNLWNEYLDEKLEFTKNKLKKALKIVDILDKNYDILLSILGHKGEKKYLVLFQNNDEIRATWWFIWSTALVTIKNWKIISVDKSDIYALEWLINKVYTEKEKAPKWLDKITKTFWLRDANYFPEIKDSSEKIKYFLDKINFNIDWIVYINQNIILDLLDSIDWVESEILWKKITSDNFSLVLSTLVESKVFKVWTLWTPKKILFDFAWEFFDKLFLKKDYYNYSNIILKHINSRDIVFYSFNSEENSLLWKLWLNWVINFNENFDFNYPVYTSIWWNKTDRYIKYRYNKEVKKIENSCNFKTKLDIYNSHHFSKFEDEKVNNLLDGYWIINKNDILNIQWRWDNKSFLRIVIPKNTIVYPKNNQKVIDYDKYKIVELFTNTRMLETSIYTIEYDIQNDDCKTYWYKFFKQPWIKKYNINFDIFWEKNKYTYISTDFILK